MIDIGVGDGMHVQDVYSKRGKMPSTCARSILDLEEAQHERSDVSQISDLRRLT